jgi:hypothetical protein
VNCILLALVVASGPLSAVGHNSGDADGLVIGIHIPSANPSTQARTVSFSGYHYSPLILLEPAGICGLRADGLNGWQKAGVVCSEYGVGTFGSTASIAAAGLIELSTMLGDYSVPPMGSVAMLTTYVAGSTLLGGTGVWLIGNRAYYQDVKWWQTTLGAGAGVLATAGLIALDGAVNSLRESGKWQGTFADVTWYGLGYVGFSGLFLFPPLGAVLAANHR